MKLAEREQCPVCGSPRIRLFRQGTFDPEDLRADHFNITDSHYGSLWTFYACRECTFVFSNPTLRQEDVQEFYSQLEDREYSTEAEGRGRNFRTIIKRLAKLDPPGRRLLDIGAASGIFLNLARAAGYGITGIEPSAFLVQEAGQLYNIDLLKGTIDDLEPAQKFSLITCLDILEHVVDPADFMNQVGRRLEPRGIVVIVTPDVDSLAARVMGRRWWHYRIAHLNFFNLKSLQALLLPNGFSIIRKRRYTWNFSFFYLVSRIFPSIKDKKGLQKILKSINFKLQLFDSWEIYARKD